MCARRSTWWTKEPAPKRVRRRVWADLATHVVVAVGLHASALAAPTVTASVNQPVSASVATAPTAVVTSAATAAGAQGSVQAHTRSATETAAAITASAATGGSASAAAEPPGPSWGERLEKWWDVTKALVVEWPSPLFEANFWNTTLAGLRVVVPLIVALLLLSSWVVRRGHGSIPRAVTSRTALGVTIAGFFLYYGFFNPHIRSPGFYEPRAFYHQYLGTKYYPELTGGWLVDCTLAAEKELGKTQTHAQRYVYTQADPEALVLASSVASAADPTLCSSRFSSERWTAFRGDVEWFAQTLKPEVWSSAQRTRAEVVSPGWRAIVSPFLAAPASVEHFRRLALIEPALHAGALLAVGYGFGPITAAVVSVVWGCQPFFPFDGGMTLFGNLALVAWLVGLSALRRGREVAGGAAMAMGICVQPLTGLACLPLAAAVVARRLRGSPMAPRRSILALGFTLAVGVGLSSRGAAYSTYASELELRASLPALTDVGLSSLLANHGAARYRFLRNDALADPAGDWTLWRGKTQSETRGLRWFALGVVATALMWSAWRRRSLVAGALGGFLLPPLLTQPLATCFGLIPAALVAGRRPELALPVLVGLAGCRLLANRTTFLDDRSAALTAVLWVTTATVIGGLFPTRARRQRRAASLAPDVTAPLDVPVTAEQNR